MRVQGKRFLDFRMGTYLLNYLLQHSKRTCTSLLRKTFAEISNKTPHSLHKSQNSADFLLPVLAPALAKG